MFFKNLSVPPCPECSLHLLFPQGLAGMVPQYKATFGPGSLEQFVIFQGQVVINFVGRGTPLQAVLYDPFAKRISL